MEDLRDAEKTVSRFAALIDRLKPSDQQGRNRISSEPQPPTTPTTPKTPLLSFAKRQASNSSDKSVDGAVAARRSSSDNKSIGGSSALTPRWRPQQMVRTKSDWATSTEGVLWYELEKPQREVAQVYDVDQTALKEFISSGRMMELGREFTKQYYEADKNYAREKPYWAAEDLFFELQSVKQGDKDAGRWVRARPTKKEWDLADHLVRFVLLADEHRLGANKEQWNKWDWSFAVKVGFYLSILRCYTIRYAKQKAAQEMSATGQHQRQTSQSSKHSSKHEKASPK